MSKLEESAWREASQKAEARIRELEAERDVLLQTILDWKGCVDKAKAILIYKDVPLDKNFVECALDALEGK